MSRFRLNTAAVVAVAIVFGVALRSSSVISIGLGSDDYVHYAMIEGLYPVKRSPFDLFNFIDGSVGDARALMDFGAVPWWNHPDFRLSMMRPLSSALIALDHAVFGKNPIGFHLHSMLWWALLVICAAFLFRQVLPARITAIALFVFVAEEANTVPVFWLANRNALVCLVFGSLGLLAHIRWRRQGERPALILALVMFALALLGGEWAFTVFAYVVAFELAAMEGPVSTRSRALLPAASIGLLFLTVQNLLGYGPRNSNLYINPLSEPLNFIVKALQRIPVLLADLFFGLPALNWQTGHPWRAAIIETKLFSPDQWKMVPGWHFWHLAIGFTAAGFGFFIYRWAIRSQADNVVKEIRWLLLGALLSMIPIASSVPASRSLLPAALGFSPLFALALLRAHDGAADAFRRGRRAHALTSLVILLGGVFFHFYLASRHSIEEIRKHATFFESVQQWVLRAEMEDKGVEQRDVFFINGIEHTSVLFFSFVRHFHGHPLPRSCRVLSAAPRAHDIVRTAPRQLEYQVLGGTMMNFDLETFYRTERFPFNKGDTVQLDGLRVEIVRLVRGKPLTVRFTFEKPLEDHSYLFLHSTAQGLRRFSPPRIGEKVRLPKARFPSGYSP